MKNILSSFTGKIGLIISFGILIIAIGSTYIIYQNSKQVIIEGISERLKDIGRISATLFTDELTRQNLGKLQEDFYQESNFVEELVFILQGEDNEAHTADDTSYYSIPDNRAKEMMGGEEYQQLVDVLRKIRTSSSEIIFPVNADLQPLYILRTTGANLPEIARISIVSQVLRKKEKQAGESKTLDFAKLTRSSFYPTEDLLGVIADADYQPAYNDGFGNRYPGNPIGNIFVTPSAKIYQAFLTGKPISEDIFVQDEFGNTQLSAYTPIRINNANDASLMLVISMNVNSQANSLQQMLQICISAVILAMLLGIIITYFISLWINRPIKVLSDGAWRVSQRDFSTKIAVDSGDEMGKLANTFNLMVEEISNYSKHLTQANKAYERFVPKQFLLQLDKKDITQINLGDQVEKEMSILFSDIRSFTAISENLSPEENFEFLNNYLDSIAPQIEQNHGFIERFIGDGVVALFPDSSADHCKTAVQIYESVKELNLKRQEKKFPAIEIGIGLHSGRLILGTIGEENRMNSTVISEAMSISERLEDLTKVFGVHIIASETQLQSQAKQEGISISKFVQEKNCRLIGNIKIRGSRTTGRLDIYDVFGCESPDQIDLRSKTCSKLTEAIDMIRNNKENMSSALKVFREIHKLNPKDNVAKLYIERCMKFA